MKCDYCGAEEDLPFICNYCGGTFCPTHRLPEAHACRGDLSRRLVDAGGNLRGRGGGGYGYSYGARPPVFSRLELRDIVVAWFALGVAFVIAERGDLVPQENLLTNLVVSLVTVGSGFVLHELMHKAAAMRFGYWAEFKMWPMGILIALLISVTGFIFAALGATYISGYDIPKRQNGLISLAGPLTNVVIGLGFFSLLFVGQSYLVVYLGFVGFEINFFLATFNLLPIFVLDGSKVFHWNKAIWAVVFIPLAIVTYLVLTGEILTLLGA